MPSHCRVNNCYSGNSRCIIVTRRRPAMRAKLAQRQAAMRKKLMAARETFRNCAFRDDCLRENPELDPEFCSRCSASTLQKKISRSHSATN